MFRAFPAVRVFLASLAAYAAMVVAAQGLGGIFFESNDDVAMMMQAAGFGLYPVPTPLLLFSNVWQGLVVTELGWPFGRSGYALYLFVAQVTAMAAITAFVAALNGRPWLTGFAVAVLGIRPILLPQFTLTAGFLAAAAVLALLLHARRPHALLPACAAGFALLAFLMREHQLAAMLLVAVPLLLSRALLRDLRVWLSGLALACIALAAQMHHRALMSGPGWDEAIALNLPRAAFTDFNLGPAVAASAEALRVGGLSRNDVIMLASWWFIDPDMASVEALRAAIAAVGPGAMMRLDAPAIEALWANLTLPRMLLPALLLPGVMVALRGAQLARIVVLTAVLVGLAVLLTSTGRPEFTRVLYPGLVLVVMAGMACLPAGRWPVASVTATGLVAGGLLLSQMVPAAWARERDMRAYRAALAAVPLDRVHVVWGAALPFEGLYPPLAHRSAMPALVLFGLGTAQRSPPMLAHFGGDPRNVIRALTSEEGLSMFTNAALQAHLAIYCTERLG